MTVGIFEAKQKLSELVERASQGEEIVITAGGRYAQKRTRPSRRRVVKVEGQINRVGALHDLRFTGELKAA